LPAPGLRFCPYCGGALTSPGMAAGAGRVTNPWIAAGRTVVAVGLMMLIAAAAVDWWERSRSSSPPSVDELMRRTEEAMAGTSSSGLPGVPVEKVRVEVHRPGRRASLGSDFMETQPAGGNTFWYCVLVVTNVGTDAHHANPNNVSLVTTSGRTFSYSPATHVLAGHDFPAVDLQPGKTAMGLIVFEIPEDSKPQMLVYEPMFGSPVEWSF